MCGANRGKGGSVADVGKGSGRSGVDCSMGIIKRCY